MEQMMKAIATPQWMLAMFKAIDTLDLSPTGGFAAFDDNIYMNFHGAGVQGKDSVKQFFVKLDSPLTTEHFVTGVWQIGNAYIAQGHATVRGKKEPVEKTHHIEVGFNIFWLNEAGKVVTYIVSLPPGTGKVLGTPAP
jgi:hypothetical protein